MPRPITRLLPLLLAIIVLAAPDAALAQRGTSSPVEDFPIPNGYFFTQAAPGQNGAGYRVANEAGIPLWDEFRRHGGLGTLGYPASRRFMAGDRVAQLFQFGTLRWDPVRERAELLSFLETARAPEIARRAEPPPRSAGEADRYPWSGWWWPANNQAGGPRLFDLSGPLAKYDRLTQSLGQPDPRTMEWEEAELLFAGLRWAGHCNGWAAAALLEPEPTETRVINGITFSVADQKGLLTSWHFADSALWAVGHEDQEMTPVDFHKTLIAWMGDQRKGMVFTFRLIGEEVWSYPAFKYELVMGPDAARPDVWHVRTVVWFVDNDVPATFVGGRPWPAPEGKVFEYSLFGDPRNPSGGEWGPLATPGGFGRPYMLWYPDPQRRNEGRQLTPPALDYTVIQRIVKSPS